jgi:hypothetical protein
MQNEHQKKARMNMSQYCTQEELQPGGELF